VRWVARSIKCVRTPHVSLNSNTTPLYYNMQFEYVSPNASSEQTRTTYLRALARARQGLRMESIGGDKTPDAIAAYSEAVALCDDVLDNLRDSDNPERVEEAMKVQTLVGATHFRCIMY
jgi:hypothetical protein